MTLEHTADAYILASFSTPIRMSAPVELFSWIKEINNVTTFEKCSV